MVKRASFAIRIAIFIILTALGIVVYTLGWDYLRSPHSDIVDMMIRPAPSPNQEAI